MAAEVQRWGFEQVPLTELVCGWKEMMIWLLWFAPYRTDEIWPEVMTGGSRVVGLGEGDEQTTAMVFPPFEILLKLN